jgi:hypothetical protein
MIMIHVVNFLILMSMTMLTSAGSMLNQESKPAAGLSAPSQERPLAAGTALDPDIDALLTKLEQAADDLRDFQSKLTYEKYDPLLDRTETRAGELVYQLKPDGTKRFAVLFDTLFVLEGESDVGRKETKLRHYIFDGVWLAEIDHDARQFIKRQVVAPGEQLDPLKLGEGPFPLPIGQKKADILARFDVQKLQVPSAGLLARLTDVDGVALIPKAGTHEARDFSRVEIFYDRNTMLPVGVNALGAELMDDDDPSSRERKTVWLRELKRNEGVDEGKLDITPPRAEDGWRIDVQAM